MGETCLAFCRKVRIRSLGSRFSIGLNGGGDFDAVPPAGRVLKLFRPDTWTDCQVCRYDPLVFTLLYLNHKRSR